MLTCANCGNEEPEGSQFCGSCGTAFAPADPEPTPTAAVTSSGTMLTCANCGNEEPEGSQFCGSCGTALAPADKPSTPTELAPGVSVEPPADVEPAPTPAPAGERSRLRWVVAGAIVALLVAGGATAALLSLTGDGDSTEAIPTVPQPLPPPAPSEPPPPAASPALADSIAPYLEEIATSQAALNTHIRSVQADPVSVAALRDAAAALAADVVRTQGFLDGLAPNDSTEASTLALLRLALAAHLGYAYTVSGFPALPEALTNAHAQAAMARAEQARLAYASVMGADPTLPVVYINGSDHTPLLAVVQSPTPPPPTPARHEIDLVPLLVGPRPDDPLGQGRCFGPYGGGSLRVSGVVYRSGFIQCGDGADGDPSRASGVYRFSGLRFPAASRLIRITGQAVIDEWSSPSQRGSSVTWTVLYDGTPICSETVVWSESRPLPGDLDCTIPPAVASGGFDPGRLRVQQVAKLASTGDFWAGLLNPTIVVEPLSSQGSSARPQDSSKQTYRLRWPSSPGQTATYQLEFESPQLRAMSLHVYGKAVPRGFGFDFIVACEHRGPASLNWDWTQSGGYARIKVTMTTGTCDPPGPTVAGTYAALTFQRVT